MKPQLRLTIAGTDIYHYTQDQLTGAEIRVGGDSIRSLKESNLSGTGMSGSAFKY